MSVIVVSPTWYEVVDPVSCTPTRTRLVGMWARLGSAGSRCKALLCSDSRVVDRRLDDEGRVLRADGRPDGLSDGPSETPRGRLRVPAATAPSSGAPPESSSLLREASEQRPERRVSPVVARGHAGNRRAEPDEPSP